ncbi:hypothetical protein [Natronosalvus halobius]|uniref:hypothetical protein n=1 Tax=Natronosalvus halobius TaxID=2953746 RepID=UPI00209E727F|nr:hypothetical protein [Natronosalvus halobius]USZ73768.1 hypothetical protein NGM15_18350 [Natronosalvus halobius]
MSDFERDDVDRIEEFYRLEHASGCVYVGRRGITAIKAADFDEDGTIFPLGYTKSELERKVNNQGLESVSREDVPDRAENYLEHQFYARAVNLGMADIAGETA